MRASRLLCAALLAAGGLAGCDDDGGELITVLPDAGGAEGCPDVAPVATIEAPGDGSAHTAAFLEVRGTATGAGAVEVVVDDGAPLTAAGERSWSTTVQLTPGPHTVRVTPKGRRGCGDGATVTHTVVQGSQMTLVAPPPPGVVELRLDRLALERLLTEDDQKQIVLARLDLAPLVGNALAALEDPAAYGLDTRRWTAAERNLAGLLVMSPDTADLSGTALAPVMDLSAQLGLPPPRILSDMLGLAPSERFLSSEIVTDVMLDLLIRSHPNFTPPGEAPDPEGRLAVTLHDGLGDLAPLADKYGPSGDHPGFIAEPPSAELFTPAFAMVVRGEGNITVLPGLRPGEGFASHVVPPPAGEAILALDFRDPDTFRIEGLHPEPRAALTLEVPESPMDFAVPAPPAMGRPAPPGDSAVWDAPPWTLEHIVAEASRRAFADLWPDGLALEYALGAIDPAAQVSWDAGWVVVDVVAELGPPPAPAYIWDLILDVAQQRLHDGVEDGQVIKVRLELPLLPIGLDADQLVDVMRPALEAQKETLVAMMVGAPDALPSEATIWLDGQALVIAGDAAPLYPSRQALAEDIQSTRRVELGEAAQTWWTRSPGGQLVVLDVGEWRGDRVSIGQTVMPEEGR
ncbi:MAG: hypothetical protein R3F65_27520 [bacterium]